MAFVSSFVTISIECTLSDTLSLDKIRRRPVRGNKGLSVNMNEAVFFAHTKLPTEFGEFDVRVFKQDEKEHLAISCGDLSGDEEVTVRVHSECLTSEVLGSLKCDCKAQLDLALKTIASKGRGVVLYLRQEGRGIGLGNKIRAYALQEQGADTVDANRLLGLEDDTRCYQAAAEMLKALDVGAIRLMTNNPEKVRGLEEHGVKVVERVEAVAGVNHVNRDYLVTKTRRMGHLIEEQNLLEPKSQWRIVSS
jgi:GTP cyclohydrolase II